MKATSPKCRVELRCRQRRHFVEHPQRLNEPAIEENPARRSGMSLILLDIAPKDLLREGDGLGARALAAGPTLRNDGAGGLRDRAMAPRAKLGKQRRLADTRAAGDQDARHCCAMSGAAPDIEAHPMSGHRTQPPTGVQSSMRQPSGAGT